jgi:hypothetical protein
MKKILHDFGIDIALMITGMFGSLIMVTGKKNVNVKTSIIGVISGTLSANYLTPVVSDMFSLTGRSQFGIAFLLGYFGLKGVEMLIEKIQNKYTS